MSTEAIYLRPSKLVKEILQLNGISQPDPEKPWRCVTLTMPDGVGTVDDMICISDRDDIEVGRYLSDSSYRLNPHIQVIVRAVGFGRSYDKMREITDFLDTVRDYTVRFNKVNYEIVNFTRTTNVQYNGVDNTGHRYVHTIEYDMLLN